MMLTEGISVLYLLMSQSLCLIKVVKCISYMHKDPTFAQTTLYMSFQEYFI